MQREIVAFRKDGASLRVRLTTVPFSPGTDGAFVFFQTEDISAQKDAEERCRSLFDHNPSPVVAVSPDGTILDINPAALTIAGFTRAEVLGAPFHNFIHPGDQRRSLANFGRTIASDSMIFEIRAYHRDGTIHYYDAIDILRELKETGIWIAIDDFGTRHSAFSYLRRFAIDIMKIDQTFIDGIGEEADDEIIVKPFIAMGHSLGLVVVAEGVETQAQFAFLSEQRCDRVQGFCVAFPMDAEAT
ncbi:MAG: EAL domain-containing protein [Candidatus Eremiobacteraeota bacterium]|nr:EAL domain-containing protein [Candidatus Eremiobacteraeota bacterium]